MISATAEYALRAVLLLARAPKGTSMRSDEVAEQIGAPRNYLSKTLRALARAGVVRSSRGPSGGFWLASNPEKLDVARIVSLFDDTPSTTRCLVPDCTCTKTRPCAAHKWWREVQFATREPLQEMTVGELVRRNGAHGNGRGGRKSTARRKDG